SDVFSRAQLAAMLAVRFASLPAPVLVAQVRSDGDWLLEQQRGFIVPDDWAAQAECRRQAGTLPA
ncbi:MAG: hypothetical protein ACI83P_002211, partial [Janthinobacterium sp.]